MGSEFLILLSISIFFASLIHGSIGFGFPLITTSLLALYTDLQTAIIYTLIPTVLVNLISIFSEGKIFNALKKFWLLAFFASLGSAFGTFILISFNNDSFKLLLAFSILIYLLIDFKKIQFNFFEKKTKLSQTIFGINAGLLGGLTNAMGPILIIYTLESKLSKKDTIQASNICFFLGKVIQIIFFSFASAFTSSELNISFYMLFIVIVGMYIGVKIKNRIEARVYKKMVKLLLFIISIILISKSI